MRKHKGSRVRKIQTRSKVCMCVKCNNQAKFGYWDALTSEFTPKWCEQHLISYNENSATRHWKRRNGPKKIKRKYHCPLTKRARVNCLLGYLLIKIFLSYNQFELMEPCWYFRIMLSKKKQNYKPSLKCLLCGQHFKSTAIRELLNFARGCQCTKNILASSEEKYEAFLQKVKSDTRGITCLISDYTDWNNTVDTSKSLIPMKHIGTDTIPGCNEEIMVHFNQYYTGGYFGCSCYDSQKRLVRNNYNKFVQKALQHTKQPMDIMMSKEQWKATMLNAHCKPVVKCRQCGMISECSTIASLFMLECGFDCNCTQWRTQTLMQIVVSEYFPNHTFEQTRHAFLVNNEWKDRRNNLELDYYCKELKLAFEYDGRQHYVFIPHFHRTEETFLEQQQRDKIKDTSCIDNDICLIRCPWNGFDGDPTKEKRENTTKLSIVRVSNMIAYIKFNIEKWKKDTAYNNDDIPDLVKLSSNAYKRWRDDQNEKATRKKLNLQQRICKATKVDGSPCTCRAVNQGRTSRRIPINRCNSDYCGRHQGYTQDCGILSKV